MVGSKHRRGKAAPAQINGNDASPPPKKESGSWQTIFKEQSNLEKLFGLAPPHGNHQQSSTSVPLQPLTHQHAAVHQSSDPALRSVDGCPYATWTPWAPPNPPPAALTHATLPLGATTYQATDPAVAVGGISGSSNWSFPPPYHSNPTFSSSDQSHHTGWSPWLQPSPPSGPAPGHVLLQAGTSTHPTSQFDVYSGGTPAVATAPSTGASFNFDFNFNATNPLHTSSITGTMPFRFGGNQNSAAANPGLQAFTFNFGGGSGMSVPSFTQSTQNHHHLLIDDDDIEMDYGPTSISAASSVPYVPLPTAQASMQADSSVPVTHPAFEPASEKVISSPATAVPAFPNVTITSFPPPDSSATEHCDPMPLTDAGPLPQNAHAEIAGAALAELHNIDSTQKAGFPSVPDGVAVERCPQEASDSQQSGTFPISEVATASGLPSLLSRIGPRRRFAGFVASYHYYNSGGSLTTPAIVRSVPFISARTPSSEPEPKMPPAEFIAPSPKRQKIEEPSNHPSQDIAPKEVVSQAISPRMPLVASAPRPVSATVETFAAVSRPSSSRTPSRSSPSARRMESQVPKRADQEPASEVSFFYGRRGPFTREDGTSLRIYFCPLVRNLKQRSLAASSLGGIVTPFFRGADLVFHGNFQPYRPASDFALQNGLLVLHVRWMDDYRGRWEALPSDWYPEFRNEQIEMFRPFRKRQETGAGGQQPPSPAAKRIKSRSTKYDRFRPYQIPSGEALLKRHMSVSARIARDKPESPLWDWDEIRRSCYHSRLMPGSFSGQLPWDEPCWSPTPPTRYTMPLRLVHLKRLTGNGKPKDGTDGAKKRKMTWQGPEESPALKFPDDFRSSPPTKKRRASAGGTAEGLKNCRRPCGSSKTTKRNRRTQSGKGTPGSASQPESSEPISEMSDFIFSFVAPLVLVSALWVLRA